VEADWADLADSGEILPGDSISSRQRARAAAVLLARAPQRAREAEARRTDQDDAYTGVIPAERQKAITKPARQTKHIERFKNALRQRVSRLVRETLSFSKKLAHHIGALKYCMCHYNLTRTTVAAFPV